MKAIFAVLLALLAPLCFAQGTPARAQIEPQLPTDAELTRAWSLNIDKDSPFKGTTPGKYFVLGDKMLFYPYEPSGSLSKKPIQLPKDWLYSIPDHSKPTAYPGFVASGVPSIASSGFGASDQLLQKTVAQQSALILTLTTSVQELQRSLDSMKKSNQELVDSLRKQVDGTEARVKLLEAKAGAKP